MNFAIEDNRKFTFHYASIKTIRLTPMLSMTVEFTFHYASIKTHIIWQRSFPFQNLHFIMLLLKPDSDMKALAFSEQFTFHYASIKTYVSFIS